MNDWEALVSQAQTKLDAVLQNGVAPVAEKILKERIAKDIYAAYTPAYYERRHVLEQHVESNLTGCGTLLVTSTAGVSPSIIPGYTFENRYPGAFLEMLETGNMGFWRKNFPRPAVARTQEELDKSREIDRVIRDSLKREFG